ncbi:FtsX-like permease family protein [Frateuria aurantia]
MDTLSQLAPMLASFKRHRLTVLLLLLQVATTFAIFCNAAQLTMLHLQPMRQHSGVAEHQLLLVESTRLDPPAERTALQKSDLAALRQLPGVASAVAVDALPFNGVNWRNGIRTGLAGQPGRRSAQPSAFNGTPGERQTLGLRLIAGRDFQPDEYVAEDSAHGWDGINHVSATIITAALAHRLFPDGRALGSLLDTGGPQGVRIVGIVDTLAGPTATSSAQAQDCMLFPMRPDTADLTYVLRLAPRVEPQRLLASMKSVLEAQPGRKIIGMPIRFTTLRARFFRHDRELVGLLLAAMAGLALVTAIGLAGLASFWVQQRRASIGVRRALGSSRRGIRLYFQLENALIVCLALPLGITLSYALNHGLMQWAELPRLPAWYLAPVGLGLLVLGQLAIIEPVRRVATIAPMTAIRG